MTVGHAFPAQFQGRQAGLPANGGPGQSRGASGAARAGEPLPSIRPLAEELRVNRNTIAKAYAELESQGVIETDAGQGLLHQGPTFAVPQGRAAQAADRRNRRGRRRRRITCRWTRRSSCAWPRSGSIVRANGARARQGVTPMIHIRLRHRNQQPRPPLRPHRRRQRPQPARAARPLLRLLRPQRRRQDHHDQMPAEPAPADARQRARLRPRPRAGRGRREVAPRLRAGRGRRSIRG